MNIAEPAFQKSISYIMNTKWLVHALRTWLDEQGQLQDPYTTDQLNLISQQTINQSGPGATHKTLLGNAKRNWTQMTQTLSENQNMGELFRNWLNQQGQSLQDHPRLTHTIAAILQDVRKAIPSASAEEQLQAIKALWTIEHEKLLAQPS